MQDKKLASDLPFKPQGLGGDTGARTALARSDTPLRNPRRPRAAILYPETHNVITALGAQFRVVSGVGQPEGREWNVQVCSIWAKSKVRHRNSVHRSDGGQARVQGFLKPWSDQRSMLVPVGLGRARTQRRRTSYLRLFLDNQRCTLVLNKWSQAKVWLNLIALPL